MRKASQTPIYRAIERLLQWAIPVAARLPKSLPFQTLGADMIRDIKQSLDAVAMAMQTPLEDAATRLSCIELIIVRMTSVRMTMRQLVQARVNGGPVVSLRQEAAFLSLLNPIAIQAGGWRSKTMQHVTPSRPRP